MAGKKTKNYNLELPDPQRTLSAELPASVGANMERIDDALAAQRAEILKRSLIGHTHQIADIIGLQTALEKKADKSDEVKFATLADVIGFDKAQIGYVPVKTDKGIEMRSAAAALGDKVAFLDKNNNWSGVNRFEAAVQIAKILEVVADKDGYIILRLPKADLKSGGFSLQVQDDAIGALRWDIGLTPDGRLRLWSGAVNSDVVRFTSGGMIQLPADGGISLRTAGDGSVGVRISASSTGELLILDEKDNEIAKIVRDGNISSKRANSLFGREGFMLDVIKEYIDSKAGSIDAGANWVKLSGSLIIVWGTATKKGGGELRVTLPVTMPNRILFAIGSDVGGGCFPGGFAPDGTSAVKIYFPSVILGSPGQPGLSNSCKEITLQYIAIGY